MRPSFHQRFWMNVRKTESCWLWTRPTHDNGYGYLWVDGRHRRVSRLSWEIHYGPIPADLDVLHHCDNPPCVRPEHLFLGTQRDNMQDAIAKGRPVGPRGEDHGAARLTWAIVREIRSSSETANALGRRYGVSGNTVKRARNYETWTEPTRYLGDQR